MSTKPVEAGKLRIFQAEKTSDKAPDFQGAMAMPWDDLQYDVTLWLTANKKTGASQLTGRIKPHGLTAHEQMAALQGRKLAQAKPMKAGKGEKALTLRPGDAVLFLNNKGVDNAPDYYGWAHCAEAGRPLLFLSVWLKTTVDERLYLSGNVQDYKPEKRRVQEAPLFEEDIEEDESSFEFQR